MTITQPTIENQTLTTEREANILRVFEDSTTKKQWATTALKDRKKPIQPNTRPAKSNDPTTWSTFEVVAEMCRGVEGYLPAMAHSKELGIVSIDLDHVVDPITRATLPGISELIDELDSYAETSVSGRGIHIFVRSKKLFSKTKHPLGNSWNEKDPAQIEVFDDRKFITITGDTYHDAPIKEVNPEKLSEALARLGFPVGDTKEGSSDVIVEFKGKKSPPLSDDEVIGKLRSAKNSDTFEKLFDKGDLSQHDNDHSKADLALVGMIAFYTQDRKQIDRIFRKSKLCRDKWTDREDYREHRTINTALKSLKKTWQPARISIITEQDIIQAEAEALRILETKDPCKGFTSDYLPPMLREYLNIKCETTESHPITILSSILSMTSATIQKKFFIPRSEYFQKLHTNIWIINISKSGAFKTTALNKGHAVARDIEGGIQQKYDELIALQGNKEAEDQIKQIERDIAERSVLLPNKVSSEAFIELLSQGRGGAVMCSEFGAWLSMLTAKFNGDLKAVLTDFYDVPPSYVYHTKGGGRQVVQEPYITICGVAALPWIQDNIGKEDIESGFFPRFLIFNPKEKDSIPPALPKRNNNNLEGEQDKQIREHLCNIRPTHGGEVVFGRSGRDLFETAHSGLYQKIKAIGEHSHLCEPFLKRWSPTLLKLAMLIRVYDPENLKHNEITEDHIVAAVSILDLAVNSTINLIGKEFGDTEFQKKISNLKNYLAKNKGRVSWEKLLKSGSHGNADTARKLIHTMIQRGELLVDGESEIPEGKSVFNWPNKGTSQISLKPQKESSK